MARGAAFRKARQKSIGILAWATLGVALVGGTFAAGTWIGSTVRTMLGWVPWEWVPALLLLVGVVGIAIDLLVDATPNKVAVWGLIVVPSVATAAPGKLGDKIGEWAGALTDWIDGVLVDWLGTSSSSGLALACIICALLMARRVVKKSAGGGGKSSKSLDLAEV